MKVVCRIGKTSFVVPCFEGKSPLFTFLPFTIAFKASSDGLCKAHQKVGLNFACLTRSELDTCLSTALYAGLNEPLERRPILA